MAKGNQFERELCKTLSLWCSDGQRDDVFWRTSQSGGRATGRTKKGKRTKGQYGDMAAMDELGEPILKVATFEFKRGYSNSTVADLIDKQDTNAIQRWEVWLSKAERDSEQAGSYSWIIIARRDRKRCMVWMPEKLQCMLIEAGADITSPIAILSVSYREKKGKQPVKYKYLRIVGFELEDLLEVSPQVFREIANGSP